MDYQYRIFAPYRVYPLGVHVDHQHGIVIGFAIDKGVDLWFNQQQTGKFISNLYHSMAMLILI